MLGPPSRGCPDDRHLQLALCHYRRGAMGDWVTSARRAIALNPFSAPAHFELAIALFHLRRLEEAGPRGESDDASAHYHLGLNYERRGLEALATSALARALHLDQSDEAAASALQELQR